MPKAGAPPSTRWHKLARNRSPPLRRQRTIMIPLSARLRGPCLAGCASATLHDEWFSTDLFQRYCTVPMIPCFPKGVCNCNPGLKTDSFLRKISIALTTRSSTRRRGEARTLTPICTRSDFLYTVSGRRPSRQISSSPPVAARIKKRRNPSVRTLKSA